MVVLGFEWGYLSPGSVHSTTHMAGASWKFKKVIESDCFLKTETFSAYGVKKHFLRVGYDEEYSHDEEYSRDEEYSPLKPVAFFMLP